MKMWKEVDEVDNQIFFGFDISDTPLVEVFVTDPDTWTTFTIKACPPIAVPPAIVRRRQPQILAEATRETPFVKDALRRGEPCATKQRLQRLLDKRGLDTKGLKKVLLLRLIHHEFPGLSEEQCEAMANRCCQVLT